MRLILSTSNIMGGHSPVLNRFNVKSNAELTASLKANINSRRASHAADWTAKDDAGYVYIPSLQATPLAEDRESYDITLKLFHLPLAPVEDRAKHVKEALDCVLQQLGAESVNLLILSFPNITFDADDESEDNDTDTTGSTNEDGDLNTPQPSINLETSLLSTIVPSYRALEALHKNVPSRVTRLGVSEFGTHHLSQILSVADIPPAVNQINLRDCCVVPAQLILFAKSRGIQLLTHNDCTNILPKGTLREILGPAGAGVLCCNDTQQSEQNGVGNGETGKQGLKGDLRPLWVVKYTAVVKNRGVVENKGYFAAAELLN